MPKRINYGRAVFATHTPSNFGKRVTVAVRADGQYLIARNGLIGPKPKRYPRPLHLHGCTCAFCYSFPRKNLIGELMPGKAEK